MAAFNIGEILSAQGRLDEAEPLLRDAERASRAAGSATDVAECSMETALLDARRGDTAAALRALDEARQAFARSEDSAAALLVDARAAEALLLGGESRAAAELATQTLRRVDGVDGGAPVLPVLHRVLGEARLRDGLYEEAREALELAVAEAERVRHRYEEAVALDGLARLDDEEGVPGEAAARRDGLFDQLGIVARPGVA